MPLPHMRWRKRSLFELAAVLLVTAVVVILAVLQYRWASQIGRAEQQRLKEAVSSGVAGFCEQFAYDAERLTEAFPNEPDAPEATLEPRVAQEYLAWTKAVSHPGIVQGVYIWKTAYAAKSYYAAFDPGRRRFEKTGWPPLLNDLYGRLGPLVVYVTPMRDDREAILYPWDFFPDQFAFVRPILQADPHAGNAETAVRPVGVLVIELDRDYLQHEYFPDLVDRTFGASGDRSVAILVRSAEAPFQSVYALGASSDSLVKPLAVANLFDSVQLMGRRRGYAPVQTSSDSRQWQLVVQEPAGSVEGLVAAWRNRNLLLSFGLLVTLAVCVAFIFVLARRSEQLARMQMEFVAGVSHELCTPLAVISSAAENLADGVVESHQQLAEYGKLIHDQSTRLDRLVDQILVFAAGQYRQSKLDLAPTSLGPIVYQVLDRSHRSLRDAGFIVDTDVATDLPLVLADSAAAAKCLENLISNAVKYADQNADRNTKLGEGAHLIVRARAVAAPKPEVRVVVEDSGIGIAAAELAKIFEPFYRTRTARNTQARGVGLGLYLVRQLLESMNGAVSATSEVGRGACFVLHFPIAPHAAERPAGSKGSAEEFRQVERRPN
jgi:signal transduction histidine kinase